MSQEDMYFIGKRFHGRKQYRQCALWMDAALQASGGNRDLDEIMDYAAFCFNQIGLSSYAAYLTDEIIRRNKYSELSRIVGNVGFYRDQNIVPQNYYSIEREHHWQPEERGEYEKLCRGEFTVPDGLFCFYYTGSKDNFFLQLGPVKTEVLYHSPHIVRFYEVYNDDEIEHIKAAALELLNRATVFDPLTHKLINADYRVSKSAWLDDADPVVKRLNERSSLISGVDLRFAEQMQMANYGIGGQYEPHFDFSRREEDVNNNRRIATWLVYLTDVEQGGGTAFLNAKITAQPIKVEMSTFLIFWRIFFFREVPFSGLICSKMARVTLAQGMPHVR